MIKLVPQTQVHNNHIDYLSEDGYSMSREYGEHEKTISGTFAGMWVLRNPDGEYLDHDRYRFDLVERNNACIVEQ